MTYKDKLYFLKSFYEQDPGLDPHALLKLSFLSEDEIKENLSHKQSATWTYKCASSVVHLIENKESKSKADECLNLVDKWLNDSTSVTKEQLRDAASYAAYDAAYYAASNATSYAAFAASYAACAASNAADAA